jgi:rabenosyn-5
MFKASRGARVDRFVVETNKLIIRLDKLTGSNAPTDSGKKKGKLKHCNCSNID